MLAARVAPRSSRVLLQNQARQNLTRTTRRFESTTSKVTPDTAAGSGGASGALTGGLVGGLAAFGIGFGYYHWSGARSAVNSISSTKQYFQDTLKKTTENAPEPNQAIKWLRQSASGYAAFVPGAKQYVDSTFDELETIQEHHGEKVDKIVRNAYEKMKDVTKQEGASIQGLTKAWQVLQETAQEISQLAGDVGKDLMNQHPELKEKYGGQFNELKKMGDQYGPEAKKKVDETWNQLQDAVKGGIGVGSLDQVRRIVQERVQEVRKLGDQAWDKGLEEAKPYLDKSPQVKEFVEKNKDKLKNSNLSDLWGQVRSAAQSGNTGDLEKFVKESADKAQQSFGGGQGLEQYLQMIPGGAGVGEKFQQLQEIGDKHGKQAEQLLKEAFEEVRNVLAKKVDEGKKIADDAKKDSK